MSDRFTNEAAQNAIDAADEIFTALPRTKQMNYMGHLNELMLFLEEAKRQAMAAVANRKKA